MSDVHKPKMMLLTGPNGAGKSTYFDRHIRPVLDRDGGRFINADKIEKEKWPDSKGEKSYEAAQIAAQRRSDDIAKGKTFASETVFSHPSKIELIKEARDAGFTTEIHHVNVKSADISVARVAQRVREGGHNVPEHKIRSRYERSNANLKEAIQIADKVNVYDNTNYGKNHRAILAFENGKLTKVGNNIPEWAQKQFKEELKGRTPKELNPALESFKKSMVIARGVMGEDSKTLPPRDNSTSKGRIIGVTNLHYVQQTGEKSAVTHFKNGVPKPLKLGDNVSISRVDGKVAKISDNDNNLGR